MGGVERFAGESLAGIEQAIAKLAPGGHLTWDELAGRPGNAFILPDQSTQQKRGGPELDWQYPFFRSDLVEAGLLPAEAPEGNPKEIRVPPGMSVLEAVRSGYIN